MANWKRRSSADQLTDFLRQELARGRWALTMPGIHTLASEFQVNRKTVEASLTHLEKDGWLVSQGPGKRRLIAIPADSRPPALRIGFLLYEKSDEAKSHIVDLFHQLEEAGHSVVVAKKTMQDMNLEPKRIEKLVNAKPVDAWVPVSGPRPVLEWFAEQNLPVMALFGRRRGLPIAGIGPNKIPLYRQIVRELISLGHTRISILVRSERRIPGPGSSERAILGEMERAGLPTGSFNLPHWDDTRQGLHSCLNELFRVTPPTALIANEAPFFMGALQFLSQRRLRVPQDVSVLCSDPDPSFDFCTPEVSHIFWETKPIITRIVNWAKNTARGQNDSRQSNSRAQISRGETIGPAPG